MNKKLTAIGFLLFGALVLSIPGAASAQYEATNLTIQMGGDESELNFSWLTTDGTQSYVGICTAGDLEDGELPDTATYYEVTMEEVLEEESSGGGGGGGGGGTPPSGGTPPGDMTVSDTGSTDDVDDSGSSDSASDETDEEEDTTVTYACKITVPVDADTQYAYVVGYDGTFSEVEYFNTKGSDNFNFIFVGDPQIGAGSSTDSDAEGWATTVTAALTQFEDTSFILSAGDQVESSTSDTQYDGFFSAAELTSLPLAPATGNHDTSVLYSYHFNVPNESEYGRLTSTSEGSEEEDDLSYAGDYWFTYGKVLFMVLNTNNSSATSHSAFMAEAIAANPSSLWRVVDFHHSLYSSARHVDDVSDLRTSMVPVMDDYNIDVVLAGHDHFYARSYPLTNFEVAEDNTNVDDDGNVIDPSGTVYFTAGSASGSKYYDFSNIDGYTNYYLAAYDQPNEPSYLNVEVKEVEHGDTLTVSAYLTADGSELDTYTIIKIAGDLNSDGIVDRDDYSIIRGLLRQSASVNPAADLNDDGVITIRDARILITLYTN